MTTTECLPWNRITRASIVGVVMTAITIQCLLILLPDLDSIEQIYTVFVPLTLLSVVIGFRSASYIAFHLCYSGLSSMWLAYERIPHIMPDVNFIIFWTWVVILSVVTFGIWKTFIWVNVSIFHRC